MNPTLRTITAATAGAVVAAAVCLGQPALAAHQSAAAHERTAAKTKRITSYQIKNHTIKTKDLSGSVNGLLGLAGSALQSVPTNGVTRDKMADNAVGSAEVVNNSLVSGDLAANSVGSSEIANGAVGSTQVADGSLTSADVTSVHGVSAPIAFGTVPANGCAGATVVTTKVLDNDLILVTQPIGLDPRVTVSARPVSVGSTSIQLNACNGTGNPIVAPASVVVPYAVIDN